MCSIRYCLRARRETWRRARSPRQVTSVSLDQTDLYAHDSPPGHVNLKEAWLPYKTLIGQVFLDASCAWVAQRLRTDEQKNPNLRTIVNKLDSIHAEFRYFDMEVLAGEPDFVTSLVSD